MTCMSKDAKFHKDVESERGTSYLVCGPYWSKYNDYYQKWDR